MPFRVSGKNIDVGEALRRRIGERIAETLGKFFDGGYSGHATISREGFGFRTEARCISIPASSCRRTPWRRTPMRVPTRPRCASSDGCGATSGA